MVVTKNQYGLELCYDGYGGFRQITCLPAHSIIPVHTFLKNTKNYRLQVTETMIEILIYPGSIRKKNGQIKDTECEIILN